MKFSKLMKLKSLLTMKLYENRKVEENKIKKYNYTYHKSVIITTCLVLVTVSHTLHCKSFTLCMISL